jgi:hypothetical protein
MAQAAVSDQDKIAFARKPDSIGNMSVSRQHRADGGAAL